MSRLRYYPLLILLAYLPVCCFMIAAGERRPDVYYSVFLLIYLIVTEICVPYHPRYRRRLYPLLAALIAIFFMLVARRILLILRG